MGKRTRCPKLDTTGLLVRLINTETTRSMEAEIDFFQAIVDSNYIIFHRTVRRGLDVFIQGFIVDARAYLTNLVKNEIEKYKGVTKGTQQDPLVLAFYHKGKSFVAFGERNNVTTELLSEPELPCPEGYRRCLGRGESRPEGDDRTLPER